MINLPTFKVTQIFSVPYKRACPFIRQVRVYLVQMFDLNKSSECPFVSDNDVCVIQKSKEVCNKIRDFSKIASILG